MFDTLTKVYGWQWVESKTLFILTWKYFDFANEQIEHHFQKQYDRYLQTLDKVQEPTPPDPPWKWCFNSQAYNQYLDDNGLESIS